LLRHAVNLIKIFLHGNSLFSSLVERRMCRRNFSCEMDSLKQNFRSETRCKTSGKSTLPFILSESFPESFAAFAVVNLNTKPRINANLFCRCGGQFLPVSAQISANCSPENRFCS